MITFTLVFSYLVAGFCSYFPPEWVLSAAIMTFFMVVGLTFAAIRMKETTIGYLKGIAIALICSMIPMIVFMLIYPNLWLVYLIECIVVTLYSLFIIFDTKNIIEHYSVDDYISASVALYIDII